MLKKDDLGRVERQHLFLHGRVMSSLRTPQEVCSVDVSLLTA